MGMQGLRKQGTHKLASILIAAAFLSGCLESVEPSGGGGLAAGVDDNSVPEISGNPKPVAIMSDTYSFTPSAFDSDGDALSFRIHNRPPWATFDAATGRLDGIPQFGDVGTYDDIVISVSDGNATASLPAFSVVVSQDGLGSRCASTMLDSRHTSSTA